MSTFLYGSVATGTAQLGTSDVDVLTVGLSWPRAAELSRELSAGFANLSRGVQIAVAHSQDYRGDSDGAYGFRVFLRHYCLHLAGPDLRVDMDAFPADVRAARGFNGDIARHLRDWKAEVRDESARERGCPGALGRRVARKTLLAVAGLVSVHDAIWTTDRGLAARRWSELRPSQASGLSQLSSWSRGADHATREEVEAVLAGGAIVDLVVQDFCDLIGLWA